MKKQISVLLLVCILLGCFALNAAAYAKGDVSGDGEITAEDARLCLRKAVGLETYEAGSDEYNACDVTGDNEVTAEDARLILRAAVGLESLGVPAPDPEHNEYEILRSGSFYATGRLKDSDGTNQPLEIAVTPDSVYMKTDMEGVEMAMLQRGKKMYMLYPAKKIYMEMSSVLLDMMGMTTEDLLDVSELGFTDMAALSEADAVANGEFNGQQCIIYTFNSDNGSREVIYMNGNRLLGFEEISAGGTSTTIIDSITADVPADKSAPPKDYKRVLMLTFMREMEGILS